MITLFQFSSKHLYWNRLTACVKDKSILHPHQFGFRVNHSTNLAIAHLVFSLISKINYDKYTVVVLLDLKKAFDLINHELLLNKLNIYGIRGLPLQWLCSYLSNRH